MQENMDGLYFTSDWYKECAGFFDQSQGAIKQNKIHPVLQLKELYINLHISRAFAVSLQTCASTSLAACLVLQRLQKRAVKINRFVL